MRQRVEDLGRLSVLLRDLLDHNLFSNEFNPHRPKDCDEWFSSQTEDRKDSILEAWVHGLSDFKEKLYLMLLIAEGSDELNAAAIDE